MSGGQGNDLKALWANAEENLAPRTLPNGKLHCAELSKTDLQRDNCLGDLEDLVTDSETDKKVALKTLRHDLTQVWTALYGCGFWRRLFRPAQCLAPFNEEE